MKYNAENYENTIFFKMYKILRTSAKAYAKTAFTT